MNTPEFWIALALSLPTIYVVWYVYTILYIIK